MSLRFEGIACGGARRDDRKYPGDLSPGIPKAEPVPEGRLRPFRITNGTIKESVILSLSKDQLPKDNGLQQSRFD